MHGANLATGASLLTRARVWLDSVPLFTRCRPARRLLSDKTPPQSTQLMLQFCIAGPCRRRNKLNSHTSENAHLLT